MDDLKYVAFTQNTVTRISYTWTIDNFTLLNELKLICGLKSPPFPNYDEGIKFVLGLRNGGSEYLYIAIIGPASVYFENTCKFTFSIKGSNIQKQEIISLPSRAMFRLVKLNKVMELLINDELVILCEIILLQKPNHEMAKLHTVAVPTCGIVEDVASLIAENQFHDVTIVTGDGYELPANKCILSARSKVFAAMFRHPLEESQLNCVTISDFNREVISEMLEFIYTGQAPNLEAVVEVLIAAADKYELDRLKAMCASCLSRKLSIETAVNTFKIAYHYNVEELKPETIAFIKMYGKNIAETEDWKKLVASDWKTIIESFIDLK